MKAFFLGVAVGVALWIGVTYSVRFFYFHRYRLQIALQRQGEVDFRKAFPDAWLSVASIQMDADQSDGRLIVRSDGKYLVNFEYLRGCVFKEFQAPYQVIQGKIQPQAVSVLQRLDTAAKPVPGKKGCASGTVVGQ